MLKKILANEFTMKLIVVSTFVIMIAVNALANIIPLNGVSTGAVSDSYFNLFAPAGITFIIWGVIYLALAGYVVFQFKTTFYSPETPAMIQKLRGWFSLSSVANTGWIFAWHYDQIGISLFFMLVILVSLIKCIFLIHTAKLTAHERSWTQIPFSIYFGWITVATIANATTFLVKLNWNGFGLRLDLLTSVIIVIGLVIAIMTILRFRDIAYGIVIFWAYLGILIKHVDASGFNGQYPVVIYTVIASLILICVTIIFISYRRVERIKSKYKN